MVDPRDRQVIQEDLDACKQGLEGDDAAAVKRLMQRLEGSAHRIADAIYAQAATDAGGDSKKH